VIGGAVTARRSAIGGVHVTAGAPGLVERDAALRQSVTEDAGREMDGDTASCTRTF
jgi:hypothetical protein